MDYLFCVFGEAVYAWKYLEYLPVTIY